MSKTKRKRFGVRKYVALTCIFSLLALAGAGYLVMNREPVLPSVPAMVTGGESALREEGIYTMLLAGTMDGYNTDTIMLLALDTAKEEIRAVSIPRDTMIDTEKKNRKINACYGWGGMDALKTAVRETTGIEPDYSVLVDVEGFMELVDVLGGVDFYVPYDMYHQDAEDRFTIDLEEGFQLLDGNHALQLVRFRGASGSDLGRIEMQKQFLEASLRTLMKKFAIKDADDIVSICKENLEFDIGLRDMQWFLRKLGACISREGGLSFHTLPVATTGSFNRQSYVYLDQEKTVELLNQTVNPYGRPIELTDLRLVDKPSQ